MLKWYGFFNPGIVSMIVVSETHAVALPAGTSVPSIKIDATPVVAFNVMIGNARFFEVCHRSEVAVPRLARCD